MKRQPAVAGQFYHGSASKLRTEVERYVLRDTKKEKVIGIISPHAGLMYSGHVAGAVYSSIEFPDTFMLIGPNHTGLGSSVSVMSSGTWDIPMRSFLIDDNLGKKLLAKVPLIKDDPIAHRFEHSLEVQLPFLAYFSDTVKILPISVMKASFKECEELGKGIAAVVKDSLTDVVIAASTDMSHYVSDEIARKLDGLAINKVLNLDPEGLYNIVRKESISMCGFVPATIMLYAAKELGAKEAKLIKYATSGEISGDYERVVGYAGVIVK